ncbi:MAG: hypothetical protein ACU0E9_07735 [Limimaricola soesokkakensis]|uniref:hypothetical protein n=1 Tax=Limimaricola soesokkakensis TaxID=1343159 RepID=UPI0040586B54
MSENVDYLILDPAAGDTVRRPILAVGSTLRPEFERMVARGEDVIEVAAPPPMPSRSGDAWAPCFWDAQAGEVQDRPAVPALAIEAGAVDLSALPAGAAVTFRNEAGEELTLTDLAEPVTLADPGEYRVAVDPPFPWLPARQVIEVA